MSTRRYVLRFLAAGAVATGVVLPAAAFSAAAQGECPAASPSDVQCEPASAPAVNPGAGGAQGAGVQVKAEQAQRATSGLPVTGGDVAGLAAVGVTALAAGGMLARSGRARRAQQ